MLLYITKAIQYMPPTALNVEFDSLVQPHLALLDLSEKLTSRAHEREKCHFSKAKFCAFIKP